MSNIRKKGITYLHKVLGCNLPDLIAVSKYFSAEESWTKKPTWWFDLPIDRVKNNNRSDYYLVGKSRNSGFVVLKVPNKFLVDNLKKFETKYQNRIRLHITTEGPNRFVDERGEGRVDFSSFEQKYTKD